MPTRRQFLQLVAAGTVLTPSLARAQNRPAPVFDISGPNSLRAHAEAHGLLVGCAIVPERLRTDAQYAATVAAQANLLVAENAMKWGALRPAPDKFDFTAADQIRAFAQAHNQRVRGHNLCWHESLPAWFAGTVTKDNARDFLTKHIQTVAGHFAGTLHSWDVVNEAIDMASSRPDGLRESPWLQLAGDDYVELAFRTAREADPAALLTYNDYGIELDTPKQAEKRDRVLALVKKLHSNGGLIDAVGVQSHLHARDDVKGTGLRDFVRELHKMNLQVFITEFDVNEQNFKVASPNFLAGSQSNAAPSSAASSSPGAQENSIKGSIERFLYGERDAEVARIYREYLTMMLAEPNVTAILTWGITDRSTWLNGAKYARPDGQSQRPLPLDADYNPTPAFFAERGALDSSPSQVGR
jgi:endo-1,4-beta-xylanase